ncbi:MAG: conserved rane protein of unknown function [Pseudonocardiales bacterium]|nr:conserved rane protein of unknown function [Pseudonocardiales bacterium]
MRLTLRLAQLYAGLVLYGASSALQVRAGLGLDPWDVFHQGLANRLGLSLGTVVILVGALVLLVWIPLRQRPGFGTVSNVLILGLALDATMAVTRDVHGWPGQFALLGLAIVLNGVATGLYIGAGLGAGPRDGMALGLARRSGRSIRLVRTSIEITVLSIGWLLGGAVGIGTVAYALLIGPLSQLFLRLFGVRGSGLDASPDDAPAVLPEGAGPASAISVSTARATA